MTPSPLRPTTGLCSYLSIFLMCAFPAAADWPPPVPADWTLTVRETAGVARSGEIVRTGVPVPRSLSLTDASTLTVVDAAHASGR